MLLLSLRSIDGYTQQGRISSFVVQTQQSALVASSSSVSGKHPKATNAARMGTTRVSMIGHVYDPMASLPFVDSSLSPQTVPNLSPMEVWFLVRIEGWYSKALKMKCPFLRRRMTDLIETLETLMRFMIIRQNNLQLVGPTMSCRGDKKNPVKARGLDIHQALEIIRKDWKQDTQKGYYVTGNLNPTIYRDDCMFDGPDPDMPVRGE